ncbi:uncharacterized protein F5891DRAFT_987773 [Suillus fuscotomentosus]|uniref:Uncharacterized protein n=1 Tax=Suillus fuscotomentosus TaxID=1912939 RepID=A0AAD4HBL1_9AGAM|nr:uncharacterized protein F5891DRAFT_987773 [Suillus fuscotomentosus]KAG1888481.1 hypothetical protein F5891DRAFT_987773 [Suillus fuscotomentosus]
MQVRHLDLKSFEASGQWLARKWMLCQKKKQVALKGLTEVGIEEEILREEWAAQVAHQTKPLTHKSKNKAAEAIAGVLMLEKTLESYQTIIHDLERCLINNNRADLQQLKKDAYLQVRMNARALKARLHDRLRQRKFELEKLERSYRNTVNELNLHSHTETSIKWREPTILKIVSTYNTLCDQLYAMIRQCKAPLGAIAPLHISRQGIFQLDVDDEIWQDVGLEDEIADPPPWLADNNVRHSICLLLDHDRCVEEENRLSCEHCVMQEWMITEWTALQSARAVVDDDIAFHLEKRAVQLSLACIEWESRLSEEDDDSASLDAGVGDEVDLMAEVEEVAYVHEYRIVDSDSDGNLEYWDEYANTALCLSEVSFSPLSMGYPSILAGSSSTASM